jgi:hypothetical protein
MSAILGYVRCSNTPPLPRRSRLGRCALSPKAYSDMAISNTVW